MAAGVSHEYQPFIGRTERREDTVSPSWARAMAATLNVSLPSDGRLLPLWHWGLFQEWVPTAKLGADGHPRRGDFLPHEPELPRRMWVGGRLCFHHPLRIGEAVSRVSTINRIETKHGASGRLLFVTIQHVISNGVGAALTEEQDLVFRGPASAAGTIVVSPANPVPGCVSACVAVDTPLLFRYSAVTGNGHRIHYDQDYTVREEGYESLLVHGPLQATWLVGFALEQSMASKVGVPRTLAAFSYRSHRPAYLRRCPLILEAWWEEGEHLRLRTLDCERSVCTTAEARFRP